MATRTLAVWNMLERSCPRLVLNRACSLPGMTLLALLGSACVQSAYAAGSLEFAVKAAFIYKFASYVDWPTSSFTSPTSPFLICAIGDDRVSALMDQAAAGQQVNTHPITVKHLQHATPDSGCDVAYVASADRQAVASNLEVLRKAPVLTITDADQTPDAIGIIAFTVRDNHVRFNIDDELASTDGLVISSKLLSLANSVKPRH